jgi:hypothetical protein
MSYPRFFHAPQFQRRPYAGGLVAIIVFHERSDAASKALGAGMVYQDAAVNPKIIDNPNKLRQAWIAGGDNTFEAMIRSAADRGHEALIITADALHNPDGSTAHEDITRPQTIILKESRFSGYRRTA